MATLVRILIWKLLYKRHRHRGSRDSGRVFEKMNLIILVKSAQEIKKIDKKYFDKFTEIAKKVEENFKEIRKIKFIIEEGDFLGLLSRELLMRNQLRRKLRLFLI